MWKARESSIQACGSTICVKYWNIQATLECGAVMDFDRVFINLAILKSNWDNHGNSIIDNFMPIVGRAIQLLPDQEIAEEDLKLKIADFSGLTIPTGALSVLIRRASKEKYGFVTRRDRLFVKNNARLEQFKFEENWQRVQHDIVELKLDFRAFLDSSGRAGRTEIEFDDAFIQTLADVAPRIVGAALRKSNYANDFIADSMHYLVSEYIVCREKEDRPIFKKLMNIAQGALLAELLYYSDESVILRKMATVRVFLDTGVALSILGLGDSHESTSVNELIAMLQKMDAKLCMFSSTYNELHGILTAASVEARRGWRQMRYRPGDVFEYFSRERFQSSDIELYIAQLQDKLKAKGINIEQLPEIINEVHLDVAKLNAYIESEIPEQKQNSRDHDLRVLTAINQIRNGQPKKFIEDCGAIFVTNNSALARSSVKFFNEELGVSDAPVCIPNHVFTMLMWLKSVNKKPNLPSEIVIANAIAALQPSEALWKNYVAEGARLRERGEITENDYIVLARALEAKEVLMELTSGDATAVTAGTVMDVLRRAKEELNAEAERRIGDTDAKRESFFGNLRRWVLVTSKAGVYLLTVFFVGYILINAKIDRVLSPEFTWNYGVSVIGLIIALASVLLGWAFKGTIDKFCDKLACSFSEWLRTKLW